MAEGEAAEAEIEAYGHRRWTEADRASYKHHNHRVSFMPEVGRILEPLDSLVYGRVREAARSASGLSDEEREVILEFYYDTFRDWRWKWSLWRAGFL